MTQGATFSSKSGMINLAKSLACEVIRRWYANVVVDSRFKYIKTRRITSLNREFVPFTNRRR